MQLKSLIISLEEWGANKGKYTGTISFVSTHGQVQINVNEAVSRQILSAVADQLVSEAQSTATLLKSEILESASIPRLEA